MRPCLAPLFGLCLLFAPYQVLAQSTATAAAKPNLRIDVPSDKIRNQSVRLNLKGWDAVLDLTVDADISFRASILLGEPIVECGVQFTQVRGQLTFPYRDRRVSVAIGPDNATLIDIHDAELLAEITGFGPHNYAIRCNPGVLGHPSRDPFNVTSSPPWEGFLCRTDQVTLIRAKPEHLGMPERMTSENWCKASVMGVTVQHYLPPKEEQIALLSAGKAQARLFAFGAMAANVSELIQAERKKLVAIDMAERLQAQAASLLSRARELSGRARNEPELSGIVDTLQRATAAVQDMPAAAQARTLRAAIGDTAEKANRPDGEPALREFLTHLIALVSDPAEKALAAELRDLARATDDLRGKAGQELERAIALRREAGNGARAFAFGDEEAAPLKAVHSYDCAGQPGIKKGRWYADATGKCLYGPFDQAHEESDGLYLVKKDDAYSFLDGNGKEVIGSNLVEKNSDDTKIHEWLKLLGMRRNNGAPLIHSASPFKDGLSVLIITDGTFRAHQLYSFVNKDGKLIYSDNIFRFVYAGPFSDGLAPICLNSKPTNRICYYIDNKGNRVLGPYPTAVQFVEGRARVSIEYKENSSRNDQYFIDTSGNVLLGPFFDAGDFNGGVAQVRKGPRDDFIRIDRNGNERR